MSRLYFGQTAPQPPDPGGRLPVAVLFPGPEKLALSTLGWQVVYRLLAARPELSVHRFFAGDKHAAPVAMDSPRPLDQFPLICVSLNFEEELRSLAALLDAASIPLEREARAGRPPRPLILIGGPLAFMNPAPFAPLADAFFVGEAEAGLLDPVLAVRRDYLAGRDPGETLVDLSRLPGIYAPGLTPTPVRRMVLNPESDRVLAEPGFSCFISPRAEFSDMLLLEVNRGCPYGCRFCAAGHVYRPPRMARVEELQAIVEATNPPRVGLVGTALTDWPELRGFLDWLTERGTGFSLSSVRADGLTDELLAFLRSRGTRTITLALEGPSRRLRIAAGKRLDENDFLRAVETCARHGVNHLKTYLIVGWPGETDDDYDEFARFVREIDAARKAGRGSKAKGMDLVTFGVSPLVPKPWTPFQWAPMASEAMLRDRIERLKAAVKPLRGMRAEADAPFSARLQGLIARGDEAVFELARSALELGSWRKAWKQGWDQRAAHYLDRTRDEHETFPWEIVDSGIRREHLWREWQRYLAGKPGHICPPQGCSACQACGLEDWGVPPSSPHS